MIRGRGAVGPRLRILSRPGLTIEHETPPAAKLTLEIPPKIVDFLERLGFNTTKLRWRMYEMEKKRDDAKDSDGTPLGLRWMKYQHKFCPECDGLVARDEKVCAACGAEVPSYASYRIMRIVGLIFPQGQAITIAIFLVVMVGLYAASVMMQGPSGVMSPSRETLYRFGVYSQSFIAAGDYWRWMSSGLFHFGLIHIGFNCMALAQVGPLVEGELKPRPMLVLITVSQITSSMAEEYWYRNSEIYGAGASGWLFGLLGFGITYFHRHGPAHHGTRNFFVKWAFYAFVLGLMLRFNNAAHFGGLVGGAALGFFADLTRARRSMWTGVWEWAFWPCLGLWVWTAYHLIRSITAG